MKVRITDCLEPFVWIWGFALVAEWLLTHPKRRNAFRWFWRVLPLSSIPPVHCRIKRVIKERTKVESATFSSERIQRHRCRCEMTRRRMKSSLLACRWSAAVPFPKYNSLHYYSNLLDLFYSIFRLLFFFRSPSVRLRTLRWTNCSITFSVLRSSYIIYHLQKSNFFGPVVPSLSFSTAVQQSCCVFLPP